MKKLVLFVLILVNVLTFSATKKINIKFNLNAKVFDYGQNIVSVELKTNKLKTINPKTLDLDTFKIHAKGELPKNYYFPIDNDKTKTSGTYDLDREITKIFVNKKGNIVIELKVGKDVLGAATLAYITGDVSRNILLDLDYTVTQEKEFKLYNGTIISTDSVYKQGKIVDEEADRFQSKKYKNGINYQFFEPKIVDKIKKIPLIIWFHGNGEGGYEDYVNNVSQKLANRGVVAFGEDRTQKIFGKAYVIAPQAPDTWYNNYSKDYIKKIKELIDDVVKNNNINEKRIYIFGASAGGYMAMRMAIEYPEYFAGVNVSAPAINLAPKRGGVETTLNDLEKLKNTPIWFVQAENDPTVPYETASKWAYENLKTINPNTILSNYPNVKIGEIEYDGHWSWIYSMKNLPVNNEGIHLFEWMSKQQN